MRLGPASRSGLQDALQDGQNDRGTKQRPLQTKSPSGAFSFLIFILMNKVARWAESAPQPGPWRACCRGPRGQGPSVRRCQPPAGQEAPVVWALGVGERKRAHTCARGAGQSRWRGKYTLFIFGFVNGRRDSGDRAGRACFAVAAPSPKGPRPFASSWARKVAWAPRTGGRAVPSPPPLPFRSLDQCFLVRGPGPRESGLWRLLSLRPAPHRPAPQGLSLVPF